MDNRQKIALILLPILAVVILVGGMFISDRNKEKTTKTYTDGTYIGEGEGFKGTIKVEVKVSDGKIVSIDLLEHNESEGYSDPAIEGIPKAIIKAQSTEVDVASGATFSSRGIMEAVEDAFKGDHRSPLLF